MDTRGWLQCDNAPPCITKSRCAAVTFALVLSLSGCDLHHSETGISSPTVGVSPTATRVDSASGAPTTGVDSEPHSARTAPPLDQQPAVVAAFATAWARSTLPPERWLAGVLPLCEATFARLLRSVDPATIPATAVTGPVRAVSGPTAGPGVYTVATDGGTLTVTVANVDGRWLVSDTAFARTP